MLVPQFCFRMSLNGSFLTEDQFTCSICLDVFTNPSSTPCGHSFCMSCISRYWDGSEVCDCWSLLQIIFMQVFVIFNFPVKHSAMQQFYFLVCHTDLDQILKRQVVKLEHVLGHFCQWFVSYNTIMFKWKHQKADRQQ